jgi:hypothetical protein
MLLFPDDGLLPGLVTVAIRATANVADEPFIESRLASEDDEENERRGERSAKEAEDVRGSHCAAPFALAMAARPIIPRH